MENHKVELEVIPIFDGTSYVFENTLKELVYQKLGLDEVVRILTKDIYDIKSCYSEYFAKKLKEEEVLARIKKYLKREKDDVDHGLTYDYLSNNWIDRLFLNWQDSGTSMYLFGSMLCQGYPIDDILKRIKGGYFFFSRDHSQFILWLFNDCEIKAAFKEYVRREYYPTFEEFCADNK